MKRRIIVTVLAVIAIIIFEIYMRTQVDLTGDTIYKCYPTGQVFIKMDLPGKKYTSAQEIVLKSSISHSRPGNVYDWFKTNRNFNID